MNGDGSGYGKSNGSSGSSYSSNGSYGILGLGNKRFEKLRFVEILCEDLICRIGM